MKDTALAQTTRFLSDEMMTLLNDTWMVIPNWKWIALIVAIAVGLVIKPLLQAGLFKLKKASPWARRDDSFGSQIVSLNIEAPVAGIFVMLLWLAAIDGLQLTENLRKYLSVFAKIGLAVY